MNVITVGTFSYLELCHVTQRGGEEDLPDNNLFIILTLNTVNLHYNGSICSQRCCHYNKFAVVKNP